MRKVGGNTVAGWCDVIPNRTRVIYSHCGTLGVGLLPEFRGKGIGCKLMQGTIDAAFAFGLHASSSRSEKETSTPSRHTRTSALKPKGFTEMLFASRDGTKIYTRWPL
jgi:L-amino acid N-acyltransferase YncA